MKTTSSSKNLHLISSVLVWSITIANSIIFSILPLPVRFNYYYITFYVIIGGILSALVLINSHKSRLNQKKIEQLFIFFLLVTLVVTVYYVIKFSGSPDADWRGVVLVSVIISHLFIVNFRNYGILVVGKTNPNGIMVSLTSLFFVFFVLGVKPNETVFSVLSFCYFSFLNLLPEKYYE